jgi:nitrogen fixation NifU-like protein
LKAVAGAPIEYSGTVLEHFRTPRNVGTFPAGTPDVLEGRAGDRRQGREISLALRLGADGRVTECRYRVYGCPASVALCSILSERLKGRTLQECHQIGGLALAEELSLPPAKRAAALLLEDALRATLARYNMTFRLQTA